MKMLVKRILFSLWVILLVLFHFGIYFGITEGYSTLCFCSILVVLIWWLFAIGFLAIRWDRKRKERNNKNKK